MTRLRAWLLGLAGVMALALATRAALAQTGGGFDLQWATIDAGGGTSAGGTFTVEGTIGQGDAAHTASTGGTFTLYGGFWQGAAAPLVVTLESFGATAQSGQVLLTWETVSEVETLGFNLYRAATPDETPSRINAALISAQAPGSGQGAAYEWTDAVVTVGESYFYWLEDVDTSGLATRYGPISVTVTAPTALALTTLHAQSQSGEIVALLGLGLIALALLGWRQRNQM